MQTRKTIFMFPGQGSQYFQMGRALFEEDEVFRESMLELDSMAEQLTGHSVMQTLYFAGHGVMQAFDRTLLTHPAIFMVEYALAQSLISTGISPDMTCGTSVGAFAAATVSGFIRVEDALKAILGQANALEECCEPGGMVAILSNPTLFDQDFLSDRSELAGINFASHFVISAPDREISGIETDLKRRCITYQRLPVSFAYHSRWIERARQACEASLSLIEYRSATLPMMCCEQVTLLTQLPAGYLWHAARRPMRFLEAAAKLEQHGAHRYIDVGPSGTLATFLKYALPRASQSSVHSILTPFGRDLQNISALAQTCH